MMDTEVSHLHHSRYVVLELNRDSTRTCGTGVAASTFLTTRSTELLPNQSPAPPNYSITAGDRYQFDTGLLELSNGDDSAVDRRRATGATRSG